MIEQYEDKLTNESKKLLDSWDETKEAYAKEQMSFQVRDREITVDTVTESLAGLKIPKVAFPNFSDWGERLKWLMTENVQGAFHFTADVYPFKREGEDQSRHYACIGMPDRMTLRFYYFTMYTHLHAIYND